jgi:hypothetical protein
VRVVEVDPGVVATRERHQQVERIRIAAHRVDPLDHDQATAILATLPLERAFERGDVPMREQMQIGARQPAAVNQGGVIQQVRIDGVASSHERRDRTHVGHVAAGEQQRGLGVGEPRDGPLELIVQLVVARDQPGGRGPRARGSECLSRRVGDPGVRSEAKVVVRGEVAQYAAAVRDAGAGPRMQHAQRAPQPGTGQGGKLLRQRTVQRGGRCDFGRSA